ncbi:Nuclear GTPase SLIP-GC [Cytospora mali]|uniref:Nuclear GTPase SLIP-GC n=1 Tax=Cytospora mali TaxID=578113 RepID=A0A194WBA3_CYTMA|nr:Nuclear GTPase SLIP-GC [Valsa mali]
MAGSPVKEEARHIKPDPGADAADVGIGSIPVADSLDIAENVKGENVSHAAASRETNIERMVSKASTEELETGVKIGIQLLENLKLPLQAALGTGETQASQWLKSIEQLQDEAKPARTVVGVVGNTGAGKSSVINALLDEERLVPTNGMRACTASATEISYNYSDDPEQLYRGEIEFISAADWFQELKTLLDDLLDGGGQVSRDCTTPDTDANLAYSKIKAVYPHLTREMIASTSPADLAEAPSIRRVLGSLKRLHATNSTELFKGLQHYVDSKDKTTGKGHVMEYWPLIKVVRIYCKADALSTGAVIVDLPGVQDSNAARAAVAESYMKSCTGLWITAAIQRAVDDKTAKNLLGDSFKRQLKYDGTYSAITFICTKTDDILESEVADSLNIEGEVGESWAKVEALRTKQREFKRKIGDLKDEKNEIDDKMEDLDTKSDQWEDLATKLMEGETVYRPLDNTNRKRKRSSSPRRHRKRRGSIDVSSESDGSYDSDGSDKENSQHTQELGTPLTEDEVDGELMQFKSQKKDLRKSRKALDEKISAIKKELNLIISEEKALLSEVKSVCIKGRNEYSRGAIANDFAMGIKELDQQTAIEEDETTFNPDEDVRDYDEVARSLPVFTVSARAYQKLSGRLRKDAVHIDGFPSIQDTEIPQLQEHAKKLTEGGRASSSRRFLNELSQLLNSMKLWATYDRPIGHSKKDQKVDEIFLRTRLTSLKKVTLAFHPLYGHPLTKVCQELHAAVEDCSSSFKEALGEQLYETFDRLIPAASGSAVATATGWGAHRSLGGLFWATYKATVRRSGVFSGASGEKDFNAELFEPISKQLAGNWERTFQRRLPSALEAFAETCKEIMKAFHDDAINGIQQNLTRNPAGLNMLNQQVRIYTVAMEAAPAALRTAITERQRNANREFTPVIQEAMQHAYDVCTAERGPGSYARMKTAMESHVDTARHTMFAQACNTVKNDLEEMCKDVGKAMMVLVDDLFVKLEKDYLAVLVGEDTETEGGTVPWAERMLRGEMQKYLAEADSWFAGPFLFGDDDEAASNELSPGPEAVERAGSPDNTMWPSNNRMPQSVSGDADENLIAQQLEGDLGVRSPKAELEL